MSQKKRQEQDSLGKINVANSNLWGAQTQRSLKNFKIGNTRMPIEIVHALAIIKMSCARTNQKQKLLNPKITYTVNGFPNLASHLRELGYASIHLQNDSTSRSVGYQFKLM